MLLFCLSMVHTKAKKGSQYCAKQGLHWGKNTQWRQHTPSWAIPSLLYISLQQQFLLMSLLCISRVPTKAQKGCNFAHLRQHTTRYTLSISILSDVLCCCFALAWFTLWLKRTPFCAKQGLHWGKNTQWRQHTTGWAISSLLYISLQQQFLFISHMHGVYPALSFTTKGKHILAVETSVLTLLPYNANQHILAADAWCEPCFITNPRANLYLL